MLPPHGAWLIEPSVDKTGPVGADLRSTLSTDISARKTRIWGHVIYYIMVEVTEVNK